jgi:hypothetical protein
LKLWGNKNNNSRIENSISLNKLLFLLKDAKLVSHQSIPNIDTNCEILLKDQYIPMKKGIVNLIRLHASGAIAIPAELRLQILASSKDVIHSWAVPSAGIKIDCVPGYSSHKVFLFLISGIFWGQCMEVCGRYHHWMPIVVYFMKSDYFFLWCTHFVLLKNDSRDLNVNLVSNIPVFKPSTFSISGWL